MLEQVFEVLLAYLSPADTAAVRCVSRSWQVRGRAVPCACMQPLPALILHSLSPQALVDRCLTTLEPFAVNTAFFSLNSARCLVYRSPFKPATAVKIHSLDQCGPAYPLHAIAGKSWLCWWERGGGHTLSGVRCRGRAERVHAVWMAELLLLGFQRTIQPLRNLLREF
jgi:hypothetical protein